MVSLKCGFGITVSQTFVAVAFAERSELLSGETAQAVMLCSPSLATVVGLGLSDFLGITLSPLLAASDYFVAVTLVVSTPGSGYFLFVVRRPLLLVFGNLFFVFFLILWACFDPRGRFALAFSYWACCSKCSRRYFRVRDLTETLHFFPQRPS